MMSGSTDDHILSYRVLLFFNLVSVHFPTSALSPFDSFQGKYLRAAWSPLQPMKIPQEPGSLFHIWVIHELYSCFSILSSSSLPSHSE